jgi:hypothetical protein
MTNHSPVIVVASLFYFTIIYGYMSDVVFSDPTEWNDMQRAIF